MSTGGFRGMDDDAAFGEVGFLPDLLHHVPPLAHIEQGQNRPMGIIELIAKLLDGLAVFAEFIALAALEGFQDLGGGGMGSVPILRI
jgi:hypothetical protein